MKQTEETTTLEPLQEKLQIPETGTHHLLCLQAEEKGQVIVHCTVNLIKIAFTRIWKTTYLNDRYSTHRSELLHVEGIPVYPEQWMNVQGRARIRFMLTFTALPKECVMFDLIEITGGDPRNFSASGIKRNESDVYHVTLEY